MLHVVPMFFYTWLRKPGVKRRLATAKTNNNDDDDGSCCTTSMGELMQAAAQQLRDLDAKQQQIYCDYPNFVPCRDEDDEDDYNEDNNNNNKSQKRFPSFNDGDRRYHHRPHKPRIYEPMRKVPFMSLDLNLDETERSDEDSGEGEGQSAEMQQRFFEPSKKPLPITRTTSATIETDGFHNEEKTQMMIVQSSSSLIDLLSSNKELSSSKAVVDLVARVAEPESSKTDPHTVSSPGSPALGSPPPAILHRTPIPTEIIIICDRPLDGCSDSGNDTTTTAIPSCISCNEEIMDPTDALIYGRIDNLYLKDVAEQMNDYLAAAEDDDITSLCQATTQLIQQHPMSCQVKYRPPEFNSFCYPLAYFGAAGWLEGCRAAYAAFPEAIGQEHDNLIGLPLHYACLHQANFAVIQFLIETYPEAARVTNAEHQTPLHCVCRSTDCRLDVVQLLLKHYPTAAQLADLAGYTPFHLACKYGVRLDVLAALQASSPTVIRSVTLKWHRPLHIAVMHGANLSTVRWLVQKDSLAVRATSEDFSTVLHYAVAGRCSADVIQFLRDLYPVALCLRNEDDETPYDVGLRCGIEPIVLQLVLQNHQPPPEAPPQ